MQIKKFSKQNWSRLFFIIWGGQVFSILGSKLVGFAMVWWLTQKTGSATILATSTIMMYIPQILLAPFIGALIDRVNRRLVMILSDLFVALATLVLAALFWSGLIQIWHIYILIFLRSLGGLFHFTSMSASTSLMVPDQHLSRISGLNQMLEGGINIAGPALGALLLGLLPMQGVLAIDVITALIAIIPLIFILIPQPENGDAKQVVTPRLLFQDIAAGLRYVISWKGMMIILGMALILNFIFAPVGSFLPLLVTEHFKGGVWHFSTIESFFGIGMITGGLLLSTWGGFRRRILTMLLGFAVVGLSAMIIGLAPETMFALAVAAMFLQGAANTLSNGSTFALLQSLIPPEMQGRVVTLLMSIGSAMAPLGLMLAAPIVKIFGAQSWFVIAGVVAVVVSVVACFIPDVANIEKNKAEHNRSAFSPATVNSLSEKA